MIEHALIREPGGRRYGSADRALARMLAAAAEPSTLPAAAIDAMTDPDGITTSVDVLFELESNRLRRPVTVQTYVGLSVVTDATGRLVNGKRVATPSSPALTIPGGVTVATLNDQAVGVFLTWADPRPINVVEIHGDSTVGQITDATVDVRMSVGGPWIFGGTATSVGGRLAVKVAPYDAPVTTYGIRVRLDGADGAPADPVRLVEIDPMLVLDVSDEVEQLVVDWSRETEPGTATSPVGSYEASRCTITLDDTSGRWNPALNASLDVGHRIEVAVAVSYDDAGVRREAVLPAGVFYSLPFDTDSESTTVQIAAVDRLGRDAELVVAQQVDIDNMVGELVTRLARDYLDLDADQVDVSSSVSSIVIPFAYPTGDLGTFLADIAKSVACTLYVDPYDRLVVAPRGDTTTEAVAVVGDTTALIRFRRPPGYDVTTSIVEVTAAPLVEDAEVELWAMPSGGVTIPVGGSYQVVAAYGQVPALDGFVTGIVADGAYTVTASVFNSDRAEITVRNDAVGVPLVVADMRVRGIPLVEGSLTVKATHAPSVARYGPRTMQVAARLAQTQAQLDHIATVLLDSFRSLDDAGNPQQPDLTFESLGLLHVTTGDRVTLEHPTKGLSGDYTLTARTLTYSAGGSVLMEARGRATPPESFLVLDSGMDYDDGHVYG